MLDVASPESVALPASAQRSLDKSLVRGLLWTGASKTFVQILSWCSTLVVARVLVPSDYGILGMATVFLGFVYLINEFGIGAAIIQLRDLDDEQIAQTAGFSICLGFALFGLAWLAAPLAAKFFNEPGVRWVIVVLASGFIIRALQVVPQSLLSRELEYRRLAFVESTEGLCAAAATLTFALLGFGYWALVIGSVTGSVVASGLMLHARRHRISVPRVARVLPVLKFGRHIVTSRIAWYVYSNSDFAIVGRVLGKTALGGYAFALTIATLPLDRIAALLGRVTPGVFSAVQNDRAELRRYVRGLTEGLALVTFPVAAGLALVSTELVSVVLGERWMAAAGPLRLVAIAAALRCLTPILSQVLVACGEERRTTIFPIAAACSLPFAFYFATRWGVTAVAAVWVIGHPILVIPFLMRYALRAIDMSWTAYGKTLWPAVSGCVIMTIAVLLLKLVTPGIESSAIRLTIFSITGAVTYAACMHLFHAAQFSRLMRVARSSRG